MNPTIERYLRLWHIDVYYMAYDDDFRGDIPHLRHRRFDTLAEALEFFPDLTDPLKYWWQIKRHVIASWEAVEFLDRYAD